MCDTGSKMSKGDWAALADELVALGAIRGPKGEVVLVTDHDRTNDMPPGWSRAPLCLAPCQVSSRVHPGLHKLAPGDHSDGGKPVCAGPAGHAGPHMCYPPDRGRYGICPTCQALVAKRAIKRHVEAHLGLNRKTPEERKADAIKDWADYLEGYLSTYEHPMALRVSHLADMVRSKRWNRTGFWVASEVRYLNSHKLDIPQITTDLRQARKALAGFPDKEGGY